MFRRLCRGTFRRFRSSHQEEDVYYEVGDSNEEEDEEDYRGTFGHCSHQLNVGCRLVVRLPWLHAECSGASPWS